MWLEYIFNNKKSDTYITLIKNADFYYYLLHYNNYN